MTPHLRPLSQKGRSRGRGEEARGPDAGCAGEHAAPAGRSLLQGRRSARSGQPARAPARWPRSADALGRNPLSSDQPGADAQKAADEWERRRETIGPANMPPDAAPQPRRSTASRIRWPKRALIFWATHGSDLLCYARRGAGHAGCAPSARASTRFLRWAAESLGARLNVTTGVMHVPRSRRRRWPRLAQRSTCTEDPVALAALEPAP